MRWIVAVGLTGWIIGCSATLDEPRDAPPPTLEPPTQQPPIAGMPPLPPTQEGVPEGGVEGVLDCPTVELPPYTRGSTAALSRQFTTSCAACHGLYGQGQTLDGASYPSVPGELTFEEFAAVVREGRATMPSFAEGFIDEATLRADYEALGALNGAAPADLRPAGGEWTWTEAQVADALARGMEAWRKPDHEGVACANCHSPDALDLAIIGYTDDAILRRSGLHIPAEDAAAVVDFIHAQRRRFNITKPCSRDWRPLQPGGAVLPGDTAAEQDLAFARELQRRNYTLVTGVVETLDDAKLVYREMVETDLRRLPIGQALPRWTEDGFNGEDHSTVNDYLSGLGRVPNDHANWYALEDAYVGNPTDANLFELLHRFRDETNDMGFGNRSRDLGANRTGRCGTPIQGHGSVLSYLDFNKKRSVYIIQHFMRMAVLGQPGWFEQPSAPFPEYAHQFGQGLNPFYKIGADFAEHNCGRGALLVSNWPEEAAEEIPEDTGELSPASQMVAQLNHPWQTLGVIYDP
ncbi:MAG: cytochrome c, partial [Myxococcota bacterium]